MILVGKKDDFEVYFNSYTQAYKDGKFFIGNKYQFKEVKSYLN